MSKTVGPTFLIVGAAKAGTTSLYQYLRQHPDVYMPASIKETFFFSRVSVTKASGAGRRYGERAVTSWSDYVDLFADGLTHPARGEACTAYLYFYNEAIPAIRKYLGTDVRIVIMLRNPVDRAYSNYMHHVRDGLEPLPFRDAIVASQRRKQAGWWWGFQYAEVGFYAHQVCAYQEAFGTDQVLVLPFDALVADARRVVQRICRFIGVDDTFVPDTSRRYNATGVPRSEVLHHMVTGTRPAQSFIKGRLPDAWRERLRNVYYRRGRWKPSLLAATRRKLTRMYWHDLEQLQALVDFDLSPWSIRRD
jgi:hypothetical protein